MNNKSLAVVATVIVIVIGLVIALVASNNIDKDNVLGNTDDIALSASEADTMLRKASERVEITSHKASKAAISFDETDAAIELPNIDTAYPAVVTPNNKDIVIEIFTSPEKGGTGTESWLRELTESFNSSNITVNNKSAGVKLRSISSGTQIDYIVSGVYVPDAITPSAALWADMLDVEGIKTECVNPRMVGNVAGVLINKTTLDSLAQTYGTADIQAIVKATEAGTITAGYTNPFASTSGLNFLASTLYSYDTNPLSEKAINGFNAFQYNVPFVAYNTMQMRDAAEKNTFTSMILEYQTYYNTPDLKNNYEFIPYGVRHDNPLYAIGALSEDKKAVLEEFNKFCMSSSAQNAADKYGFNQLNDYESSILETDGNTWVQIQKIWKTNKNAGKPIAAVFVLDTSGSMSGAPLNLLKSSLSNSIQYINSSNYIGVVSYSSGVNIDLPIGLFDLQQQSYFQGAVNGLSAGGSTATYSALAEAAIMLNEFTDSNPDIDVQPMIFLLSDGEANGGANLKSISAALRYYNIPIYTIGYNANLAELEKVASLNEAASINADTDDVVYKLKNLFNANL